MSFIVRFVTLILSLFLLTVAECIFKNQHGRLSISGIVFLCLSIITSVIAIRWIIIYNWNEWGPFKILLHVDICMVLLISGTCEKRPYLSEFIAWVCALLEAAALLYAIFYFPPSWQEDKVVKSINLVAVNDAYQVEGGGSFGSFAISENGVYRYYYQEKSGGIKQNYVSAENTTIFYTEEDEIPHLDKHVVTEKWYLRRHNQDSLRSRETGTYWNLYIPKGSIREVYQLDLN